MKIDYASVCLPGTYDKAIIPEEIELWKTSIIKAKLDKPLGPSRTRPVATMEIRKKSDSGRNDIRKSLVSLPRAISFPREKYPYHGRNAEFLHDTKGWPKFTVKKIRKKPLKTLAKTLNKK